MVSVYFSQYEKRFAILKNFFQIMLSLGILNAELSTQMQVY